MGWKERPLQNPIIATKLSSELNSLPLPLARFLVLRGIDSYNGARNYFRSTKEDLHDPKGLVDIEMAGQRIADAITSKERVLVYGDFDADGVTSTALILKFLQSHQLDTEFYIPHRQQENHGFHASGVEVARSHHCSLMIVVDCGTNDEETAELAREAGIDLIICDHHQNDDLQPVCHAHINPNQSRCSYPVKEISACALAYKMIQVTLEKLGQSPESADQYLDLVAISTICDIMPLVGENRILAQEGLKELRSSPHPALKSLMTISKCNQPRLSSSDIAMQLGPRLNAAGRLAHASEAVNLLMSKTKSEAEPLAKRLDQLNQLRKSHTAKLVPVASKLARIQLAGRLTSALVLHHSDWHPGILGMAASRMVEEFHIPAIILTDVPNSDGSEVFGSVRTYGEIHILAALTACQNLLIRYGGHAKAAGLTLKKDDLPQFRDALNSEIRKQSHTHSVSEEIEYDAQLHLSDISGKFERILNRCQPFGKANEAPLFLIENLYPLSVQSLTAGRHLRLTVQDLESSTKMVAIGFGMGHHHLTAEEARLNNARIDILCHIEENWWNGTTTTQLRFTALRPHDSHE